MPKTQPNEKRYNPDVAEGVGDTGRSYYRTKKKNTMESFTGGIVKPKSKDRISIDPLEKGGFMDKQLFKKTDRRKI